jgi:predicted  nucleic acid-binding Zn-ribbon protein
MDEQTAKRTRRTPQQRATDVDSKIEKLNQELTALSAKRATANEDFDKKEEVVKGRIAALEQKKKDILAPKPRKPRKFKKQKIQDLIRSASKAGLKPEEIAQRLGLDRSED